MKTTTARALILALVTTLAWPSPADAAGLPDQLEASYAQEVKADYQGALDALDGLAASGTEGYVLHLRRGWLYYQLGRYADSADAYQRAVSADPGAVEPLLGVALPLMALRRWAEADRALEAALKIAPGDPTALSRRAWTQYSMGRFAQAEALYAQVVRAYPADVEMRAGLGWAQLKQGKVREAQAAFNLVLRLDADNTSARDGLKACSGS